MPSFVLRPVRTDVRKCPFSIGFQFVRFSGEGERDGVQREMNSVRF